MMDGVHGSKSYWERYNYLKDDLDGKVLADGFGLSSLDTVQELLDANKKFSNHSEFKDLQKVNAELGTLFKEKNITLWKDTESFWKEASAVSRAALAKQIEAVLINPQFSGFILDSWQDYGIHLTGMVDWNRKPKAIFETVKKINRPVHILAEAEERTPYNGTSAAIKIYIINDGNIGEYGLALKVKGPNGRIWHQESLPGKAKTGVNLATRFKFPVGIEKGRFTFELNLSKNNKEVAKTEEVFLVPPETKLEASLKKISMLGNFPDTVSSFCLPDGTITVMADISTLEDGAIRKRFDKLATGGTIVLGNLSEEDARYLNSLKVLPSEITCFRASGNIYSSFHYAGNSPEFKDLPHNFILDQTFADVLPYWSLESIPNLTVGAGSINLIGNGKTKLRWGADIASVPVGKGKVIFYQYDIFNKLGKNALADALFTNLIAACTK